jgi:hypothetical protein
MSKVLRSWRVLVLAWAVLLAPQVSVLHALSHSLPGAAVELRVARPRRGGAGARQRAAGCGAGTP